MKSFNLGKVIMKYFIWENQPIEVIFDIRLDALITLIIILR